MALVQVQNDGKPQDQLNFALRINPNTTLMYFLLLLGGKKKENFTISIQLYCPWFLSGKCHCPSTNVCLSSSMSKELRGAVSEAAGDKSS